MVDARLSFVADDAPPSMAMAAVLPLEDALAFADTCELTSDEELDELAHVDIHDAFAAALPKEFLLDDDPLADDPLDSKLLVHDIDFLDAGDGSLESALQALNTAELPMLEPTNPHTASRLRSKTSPDKVATGTKKIKRTRSRSSNTPAKAVPRARAGAQKTQPAQRPRSRKNLNTASQSSTPKAVESASESAVNPPAKKRIRRQREELLYLREKVKVLERSLSTLRLDKGEDDEDMSDTTQTVEEDEEQSAASARIIADYEGRYELNAAAPESPAPASVWEGVASRQYNERERVEEENRRLKNSLQRQIQLAKSLEHILQGHPIKDLFAMPMDARSLKLLTDESHESDRSAVFEQLFADVSSAFDTFHEDVDKSTLSSISGLEDEVKIEHGADKGLAVTFRVHKKLPFSLEAVSNGMWRFIGLESPALPAYYKREHDASTANRVGRSFGTKFQTPYATLDFRCRHVVERRSVDGRVIILWRGVINPIKFSGAPIHGVRFYERGWSILERVQSPGACKYTEMTSSCTLSPLLDHDGPHQEVAVGALSDFVVESFHANALQCREAATDLIAQEELKLAQGAIAL